VWRGNSRQHSMRQNRLVIFDHDHDRKEPTYVFTEKQVAEKSDLPAISGHSQAAE